MSGITTTIIAIGLIFPILSLLTGIASLITRLRYNKHSSPIFIPFIGPFLLSGAIVANNKPLWLIPVVWIADIGTLAFLYALPRLIAEWWAVSRFTQILGLSGKSDNQTAVLTLHSTGQYLLKKKWQRAPGELGVIALGEPGTFTKTEDGYSLVAHHGLCRTIRDGGDGTFIVQEDLPDDEALRNYSLNHWILKA